MRFERDRLQVKIESSHVPIPKIPHKTLSGLMNTQGVSIEMFGCYLDQNVTASLSRSPSFASTHHQQDGS
jgi:hypothetical protein